ncbi:exodeoxyribonuclease VII small subunit [Patescibacteria group bacterium]|nr:exodeoxyribonuclease VII small subunit [Patescibacteria group bacterium]MBU1891032.1 exodeoxyribonuclease VII small subunit [Patescibacteria group bacterium]
MPKKSTSTKSFEQRFQELEQIVDQLESGEVNLDHGLEQFERGLSLAQELKKKLTEVENKVEIIKKKFSKDLGDIETKESGDIGNTA